MTSTTIGTTMPPMPIPPKPAMVRPSDPELLPKALRELAKWVLWLYVWVWGQNGNGKWTKVPYQIDRKQKASTTDPKTWADFDEAFAAMLGSQEFGLGFVFSVEDDIAGIDFDRCLDSGGKLKPWAQEYIQALAFTYLEISPSGSGLKAFVRADLKAIRGVAGGCRGGLRDGGEVEIYSEKRFFTVTGQSFNGAPLEIEDETAVVRALLAKLGKLEPKPANNGNAKIPAPLEWRSVSAEERVEIREKLACALENLDVKFRDTYNGSAEWYLDESGRPDPSAADCGFYFDLADMFRGDPAMMYAAFMVTPRGQREKAKRIDYHKLTLAYVLENWEPKPELDAQAGVESEGTEEQLPAAAPSPPPLSAPSPPPSAASPSPEAPPEPETGPSGTTPPPGAKTDGYAKLKYIVSGKGGIRPLLANAELALRKAWSGVLAFNEFSHCVTTLKEPPRLRTAPEVPWMGSKPGEPWSDHDDRLTACWLQRNGIFVGDELAGKAVMTVAQQMRFHPVRQFLDGLKWDGTVRLDDWPSTYLGVESTPYTKAVGARWMIATIARIYRPGCKADCCVILEGPQGALKSTALRTLFTPWFTDEIAELGTKDAAMQTRGVWVVELAELDAMTGAEVAKVKSFMSRNSDRFRPPYGRQLIDSPRQCVFAGTVNLSAYLKDETGGRRFWPVRCGKLRIDELDRDRNQLLAEAVVRFRQGSTWWLDSMELNELAAKEQGDRYEGDPWDEIVRAWIQRPTILPNLTQFAETLHLASTPDSVTVSEILSHAIGKRPELWMQADKNRIARILRSLGYERYRERTAEKLEWRYRKKEA